MDIGEGRSAGRPRPAARKMGIDRDEDSKASFAILAAAGRDVPRSSGDVKMRLLIPHWHIPLAGLGGFGYQSAVILLSSWLFAILGFACLEPLGAFGQIDPVKRELKHKISFAIAGMRPEPIQAVGISITRDGKTAFVALGPSNHVAVVDGPTQGSLQVVVLQLELCADSRGARPEDLSLRADRLGHVQEVGRMAASDLGSFAAGFQPLLRKLTHSLQEAVACVATRFVHL